MSVEESGSQGQEPDSFINRDNSDELTEITLDGPFRDSLESETTQDQDDQLTENELLETPPLPHDVWTARVKEKAKQFNSEHPAPEPLDVGTAPFPPKEAKYPRARNIPSQLNPPHTGPVPFFRHEPLAPRPTILQSMDKVKSAINQQNNEAEMEESKPKQERWYRFLRRNNNNS